MIKSNEFIVAYVHSMTFPNNEANAFDAVWTADALEAASAETTFVMKSLMVNREEFLDYYYTPNSNIRLASLKPKWLPERFFLNRKNYYAELVSLFLLFSPRFLFTNKQKVLYLRDPKLLRYFGLLREKTSWLRKWIMIYESHDPFGHDPNVFLDRNPFEDDKDIIQAASNFDLILTNSEALSQDTETWTDGVIKPKVVDLASPLERPNEPPIVEFGDEIVLGYIGTIDTLRGVDILIKSLRYLPANFRVRIVGRFHKEPGVNPNWLNYLREDISINDRLDLILTDRIDDVAGEIDRCDILVQTASYDVHDAKYATPQKAFGYMIRGKPILVADVPGHRQLFTEGENALYFALDPQSLAERALLLVNNRDFAQKIASGAWIQSADYSFSRRARDILKMVESVDAK